MSFTGTHTEWITRVQTTASLEVGKNNDIKRSPVLRLTPPPLLFSATQVVKRTSVLRKLTGTSLSEGRMSGMCPCGQSSREPVIWLVLLPESGNKGIPLHLSPLRGSPWTGPEEFLPQELWFWPPGRPLGDHPRPNISALTLSKGFIFWFGNIILSIFCDRALTSAARNVCQFTNLSHPAQRIAHHYSVSLVYERFVFWEGDAWEVCVSLTVFDVVRYWMSRCKMFRWSEEQVMAAPC